MKSINWVVNGVLALAIIILYVLHFSSTTATSKKVTMQDSGGTKVAYFEIDSIQNNYIFFKDVKDALQLKDMENAKQLTALKNAFAAKYQDLQKNGQYLSQGEVVARQQADAQRQADIARQTQGAQAARSGAFGGSGDYLMRGQAAGNLARQKGDIATQG